MGDNILNRIIKNGDEYAFEVIFKSHYLKMTIFANRYLNNVTISEEIVTECFMDLWDKRSKLIFTGSISSYLYKMVQNKCLNYIKHLKIENEYANFLIRNDTFQDPYDNSHDLYLVKELAEQIEIAIDSLPERCKEVFKMSRYQNLMNKEIAQKLNLSPKTVERQITIALNKLRISLKHLLHSIFV